MAPEPDPDREHSRRAGARDLALGLALLAVGLLTGGAGFEPDADRIDYFFDALGAVLVAWGLYRVIRGR